MKGRLAWEKKTTPTRETMRDRRRVCLRGLPHMSYKGTQMKESPTHAFIPPFEAFDRSLSVNI